MYKQYSSLVSERDEDRLMVDYWTKQWSALSTERELSQLNSSELWRLFHRYIDPVQPIIEAGCGLAQWVVFLQQAGYDAVGVDISLRRSCLRRASFLRSSSYNATCGAFRFRAIRSACICRSVFSSISKTGLRKCCGKPGGYSDRTGCCLSRFRFIRG